MAISFGDMPNFVQDEQGNWRHTDANFVARVGDKVLGYYMSQEMADSVVNDYKVTLAGKMRALKKELNLSRPVIHRLYDRIEEGKKIISSARAEIKKIDTAESKARKEYDNAMIEASFVFSQDEIEKILQASAQDS